MSSLKLYEGQIHRIKLKAKLIEDLKVKRVKTQEDFVKLKHDIYALTKRIDDEQKELFVLILEKTG